MINIKKIYSGKKILVTGHTGFKGSWLISWLDLMGANVVGLSKNIVSQPNHFELLGIKKKIKNYFFDISNIKKLKKLFADEKPDFVFHLAAQSLVSVSYKNPLNTFLSNSIGVANILECIKSCKSVKSSIIVTSDKCYKNVEKKSGYKETDILSGTDPYSASKSCAEIIFSSYCKSLINDSKLQIVSIRAGNVIGGGDWSRDRIIPDIIKSLEQNKKFFIRNPKSTRPWQHVLEPLRAYLIIAAILSKSKKSYLGESYNVGPYPQKSMTVLDLIKNIDLFKKIKIYKKHGKFKEAKLLSLNINKLKKDFNIKPILNNKKTTDYISDWYKNYFKNKKNTYKITVKQIKKYSKESNLKII